MCMCIDLQIYLFTVLLKKSCMYLFLSFNNYLANLQDFSLTKIYTEEICFHNLFLNYVKKLHFLCQFFYLIFKLLSNIFFLC